MRVLQLFMQFPQKEKILLDTHTGLFAKYCAKHSASPPEAKIPTQHLISPQILIAGITVSLLVFAAVPALLAVLETRKRHRRQAQL